MTEETITIRATVKLKGTDMSVTKDYVENKDVWDILCSTMHRSVESRLQSYAVGAAMDLVETSAEIVE